MRHTAKRTEAVGGQTLGPHQYTKKAHGKSVEKATELAHKVLSANHSSTGKRR